MPPMAAAIGTTAMNNPILVLRTKKQRKVTHDATKTLANNRTLELWSRWAQQPTIAAPKRPNIRYTIVISTSSSCDICSSAILSNCSKVR